MMREYTVFNVDQCENLPDNIVTGKPMRVRNPDARDELADTFLHSSRHPKQEQQVEAKKRVAFGIEMRTFTGKSGTKYLTFKTPRGSYHTFSEVIARDAAADCGSDQGTSNQRWAKLFKGRVDPRSGSSHWRGHMYAGGAALAGCAESGRRGAGVEPRQSNRQTFRITDDTKLGRAVAAKERWPAQAPAREGAAVCQH